VKNKYIKFENIVLPLKYFFTSKTNTKKTNNNSAILIKAKIKKIIDIEKNKNVIYSDKNIADILGKENIIVARRTVTKYRENLNIANSVVRSKNNIQL
jgi:RNA polymerase sigma-54 factor